MQRLSAPLRGICNVFQRTTAKGRLRQMKPEAHLRAHNGMNSGMITDGSETCLTR